MDKDVVMTLIATKKLKTTGTAMIRRTVLTVTIMTTMPIPTATMATLTITTHMLTMLTTKLAIMM